MLVAEITATHPQAVVQSEGAATQDGLAGQRAVYTIDRDESQLLVFVVDQKWILTYRETYRADCASDAKTSIQQFFAAWHGRAG